MARCKTCGASLSNDEVGLTRKLIRRDAAEFYCIRCLADQFGCTTALLEKKISQFRLAGCALFTRENGEDPREFTEIS